MDLGKCGGRPSSWGGPGPTKGPVSPFLHLRGTFLRTEPMSRSLWAQQLTQPFKRRWSSEDECSFPIISGGFSNPWFHVLQVGALRFSLICITQTSEPRAFKNQGTLTVNYTLEGGSPCPQILRSRENQWPPRDSHLALHLGWGPLQKKSREESTGKEWVGGPVPLPSPPWKRIRRKDVSLVNKKQFLSPAWATAGLGVLELGSRVTSCLGREPFPCFTLFTASLMLIKSSNCPWEPSGIPLLSAPLLHPLGGTVTFQPSCAVSESRQLSPLSRLQCPWPAPVPAWVMLNHPSNLNTGVISPTPSEVCPNWLIGRA